MKHLALLLIFLLSAAGSFAQKGSEKNAWMLQPAVKLDYYNPDLEPDGKQQFFCPIRRQKLELEEKDVFNAAAVVKDGWVWMRYRGEDAEGQFAGTSRIGLAKSRDGLQFRRTPIPVLFPDNDSLRIYEWEGGC